MRKRKKFQERVFAPCLSIRPSFSVVYGLRLDPFERSGRFLANQKNLIANDTKGKISHKAKKNIQSAIDWLCEVAKTKTIIRTADNSKFDFRINFVTMTLASNQFYTTESGEKKLRHSDQKIKSECLAPFLDILREKYKVKNYVWRAEAQRVTGNIHFHLLTDKFIHWKSIRDEWNKCQERLGYVSRFEEKHGHRDPNSTDIHSVKKIRKLGAYLSKYMAKDSEKARPIAGRNWFLSQSLSAVDSLKIMIDEIREDFELLSNKINPKQVKFFDYCKLMKIRADHWIQEGSGEIWRRMKAFLTPLLDDDPEGLIYEV